MSRERELLKVLVDVLDDLKLRKNLSEDDALNISDSVLMRAEKAIENYIARPEQTEQEPVGFIKYGRSICWTTQARCLKTGDLLYTSPPKREPLSDETIAELWGDKYSGKTFMVKNFAGAIEKAHGIGVDDE